MHLNTIFDLSPKFDFLSFIYLFFYHCLFSPLLLQDPVHITFSCHACLDLLAVAVSQICELDGLEAF